MPDSAEIEMSKEDVQREAKKLWEKYFFMTQELLKFIDKQEIDLFIEIVAQRSRLIDLIEALPSQDYRKLDEFKEIAEKIKPIDREIMYKARSWLNKSRRQNNVVRSYDLANGFIDRQSISFNRQY